MAALTALLAGPAGAPVSPSEQSVSLEVARPPRSTGGAAARAISASALAVTLPDGNRARFWPARSLAPPSPPEEGSSPFLRERVRYRIAPGSLVGVIDFSAAWTDSRVQAIPAGAYALVYAVQPAIKEHRGVSEIRDVLVLVPAHEFAVSAGVDSVVAASRRVAGTGHPAVLALLPPPSIPDPPRVVREDGGRLVLEVLAGGIPMALILSGAANPLQTRGFDR
ncbi:MAG: hypothetical protein ABJC61_04480 [Acidobacteriota bacterium]